MPSLRRILRATSVGSSFALFGVGGAYLSYVHLPLLRKLSSDRRDSERRCQDAVRDGFAFFMGYLRTLGQFDFDPKRFTPQTPDGPFVMVCNHPTLVDVIAVTSAHERLVCVAKRAFAGSNVFGPLLRYARYIDGGVGDASDVERVVADGIDRIESGYPLLVFAEGTRSPDYGMHRFGRAAFEIASKTSVPVVPVFLEVTPPALQGTMPFWRFPFETVRYRLHTLPARSVGRERAEVRRVMKEVEAEIRQRVDALARSKGDRLDAIPTTENVLERTA